MLTGGQAGLQELAGNATLMFYMSEEGKEGHQAYLRNVSQTSAIPASALNRGPKRGPKERIVQATMSTLPPGKPEWSTAVSAYSSSHTFKPLRKHEWSTTDDVARRLAVATAAVDAHPI